MTKKFERKCSYCDRLFNHWRTHWNHEKKCPIRLGQKKVLEQSTRWQQPGWHGPEMTEAEAFRGLTDKEGE